MIEKFLELLGKFLQSGEMLYRAFRALKNFFKEK